MPDLGGRKMRVAARGHVYLESGFELCGTLADHQHAARRGGGGLSHESGYPNLRISSQIALFRSPLIPTRQLTAVGFKIAALPVAYNDLSL